MEQRFNDNRLDLKTLQEFCEWEGVAVAAFSYFLPFCIILYLVERMASWVMPHDAAHGLIVHAHFVEDEEENLSLAVKSQKDFISLHPQTD